MKPDQKGIYCLAGRDNLSALRASPKLEPFTSRGYEVLLMTDPVDEVILSQSSFILPAEAKPFLNVASDDVTPDTDDEKKANDEKLKAIDTEFSPLKELAMKIFADRLESVRPSFSLSNSPACLRDAHGGMSIQFENMLRAAGQEIPRQKRILELNASHPVVKKLMTMAKDNSEGASNFLKVLYDQALILEGALPENPADFVKRIDDLMSLALVD